jgi:hypothetical protein
MVQLRHRKNEKARAMDQRVRAVIALHQHALAYFHRSILKNKGNTQTSEGNPK